MDRIIKTAVEARIPVIATGPPGTGKTGYGLALRDWPCSNKAFPKGHYILQVIGSVREPTDIGGWPMRTPDGIVLEPPYWAKHAMKLADEGWHVIIMWDEMRTVTAPQQAALLKVIHENKVGDADMPRSVSHMAFANSVEDSAGGVPLEPPMANRHVFVDWKVSPEKWCKDMTFNRYAPQGFLSEGAAEVLGAMRAEVASYIHHRPENLLSMPQEEDKRDGPWPSPRTWDYAAHLWATSSDESWSFREDLLASCVGFAAAADFVNWRESLDLLSPDDIFAGEFEKDGKVFIDKLRPDRTFAIFSAVMSSLVHKWTVDRYEAAWAAEAYAAKNGAADIAGSFIHELMATAAGKDVPPSIVAKHIEPFRDLLVRAKGDQA